MYHITKGIQYKSWKGPIEWSSKWMIDNLQDSFYNKVIYTMNSDGFVLSISHQPPPRKYNTYFIGLLK